MSVLDTSAVLAYLFGETGAEAVEKQLPGATIHTVNWAEVLSKLAEKGLSAQQATEQLTEIGVLPTLTVDPGTLEDAAEVARLRPLTRALGLSLGDRYCLALASRLGQSVVTADREWDKLAVGVPVVLIR